MIEKIALFACLYSLHSSQNLQELNFNDFGFII